MIQRAFSGLAVSLAALAALALLFALSWDSGPAGAHAPGVTLSGFGTSTADGVLSPGEWDSAAAIGFPINVPEGGTTPGTLRVMNDGANLYLAVSFPRSALDGANTASFQFDNDHSGLPRVVGDDFILRNTSTFTDGVRTNAPPCPAGSLCGLADVTVGGTTDGSAALLNDGTTTVYEFSHPLDSADDAHDVSLQWGDTVGFATLVALGDTSGIVHTDFPGTDGNIVIAAPPPLSAFGTPTIDGAVTPGEWDAAAQVGDPFLGIPGSTLFVMNDFVNLYLALAVPDASLTGDDLFEVRFDNSHNAVVDDGDDNLFLSGTGARTDAHFDGTLLAFGITDTSQDGAGAVGSSAGTNVFEISHALASGDADDIAASFGDTVGLCVRYFLDGTAHSGLISTTYPDACQLTTNAQARYADVLIAHGPPTKDPGTAYVDANNDRLFSASDGDVLLNDGELADGFFDTDVPEGTDYTSAIQGAGLVIPASAGPLANQVGWTYSADGDLVLDTNLSAHDPSAETRLTSRHGDVVLDDPTIGAKSLIRLQALEGDVIATDDVFLSEAGGQVQIIGRNVDVSGSTLRGERLVSVEATSGEVRAVGSLLAAALPGLGGEVRVEGSQIDVSHSTLKAGLQVLIDAFTNRRGSVVAVGAVINHIGPTGDGPTAMQGDIGGGLGVAIYAYDDIDVSEATVHSRDVIEIASGRDTFGTGLHVLACDGGGGGHLTIGGGDSTLVPNSMLRGARGVFLSAGGFPGDRLDVSNSLIADTYDGPGDHYSFGIAPVLLGARDIDADGSTILGGAGAPVLFPFGGSVSTAGATVTPGFNSTECHDVAFGRGQRPNVDFAFDAVLGASGAVDGRASVDVGGLSFAGDIDCGSVSGDLAILGGTSDSGTVDFVLMVSDDPDGIIVGTGRPNCDTTGFGNPASLPLSNGNIFVFDH